jgi:hypothetical protein
VILDSDSVFIISDSSESLRIEAQIYTLISAKSLELSPKREILLHCSKISSKERSSSKFLLGRFIRENKLFLLENI